MTEQSLAALAGHDPDAARTLADLGEQYRREGIGGLRYAVWHLADDYRHDAPGLVATVQSLIVEAVLTIAERSSKPMAARRAWDTFDAAEDASEREQIEKGGNR